MTLNDKKENQILINIESSSREDEEESATEPEELEHLTHNLSR